MNEITLDFSRFEARVAGIEKRMLRMEAFLAQTLVVVFNNEPIVATIVEQVGEEKAKALVDAVTAYLEHLKQRGVVG